MDRPSESSDNVKRLEVFVALKGPFKCELCPDHTLKETCGLRRHYKTVHRVYPTIRCKESRYNDSMTRMRLVPAAKGRQKCEICKRTYNSVDTLRVHLKDKHYVYPTVKLQKQGSKDVMRRMTFSLPVGKPSKCETCHRTFSNMEALRIHYKTAHNIIPSFNPRKPRNVDVMPKKDFYVEAERSPECQMCNRAFARLDGLRRHYRNVHKINPGFRYNKSTNNDILQKMKFFLPAGKITKCELCHRTYSRVDSLRVHYKKVHNIYPKFQYISQKFHIKNAQVVSNRLALYQKAQTEKHLCEECGSLHISLKHLLAHRSLRHPKTVLQKKFAVKNGGLKGLRVADPDTEEFETNTIVDAILKTRVHRQRKHHGVYVVAIVPEEARVCGLYHWLKNNEKNETSQGIFYIGKSFNGKPSNYHINRKKSHNSSIARAIRPHLKKVAFLIRSILFRTTAEATCQQKAAIAESQLQSLLYSYAETKEKPNRMQWTMLNQKVEPVDMGDEQLLAAVTLGIYKTPLVVVDPSLTEIELEEDCGFEMQDFAFGESFFRILKEDDIITEIPYVEPIIPFREINAE